MRVKEKLPSKRAALPPRSSATFRLRMRKTSGIPRLGEQTRSPACSCTHTSAIARHMIATLPAMPRHMTAGVQARCKYMIPKAQSDANIYTSCSESCTPTHMSCSLLWMYDNHSQAYSHEDGWTYDDICTYDDEASTYNDGHSRSRYNDG